MQSAYTYVWQVHKHPIRISSCFLIREYFRLRHLYIRSQSISIVKNIKCNTDKCSSTLLYETTLKIIKITSGIGMPHMLILSFCSYIPFFSIFFKNTHPLTSSFFLFWFIYFLSLKDNKIRRKKREVGYYFPNLIPDMSLISCISKITKVIVPVGKFSMRQVFFSGF